MEGKGLGIGGKRLGKLPTFEKDLSLTVPFNMVDIPWKMISGSIIKMGEAAMSYDRKGMDAEDWHCT